jgi:sugar phosphate isomerase/epimerase
VERRDFLRKALGTTLPLLSVGVGFGCSGNGRPGTGAGAETNANTGTETGTGTGTVSGGDPLFRISLAEWSLHRALQSGEIQNLDFAGIARNEFDIDAVEYVNVFFFDHAQDEDYLRQMKVRAEDAGVGSLLIMCDREGSLGAPDETARRQAVDNHVKWLEAAAFLSCHSIRVNAQSDPELGFEEQQNLAADGLRKLCELAEPMGLNVLVENHGGLSSNGKWLSGVMERVDHPRIGTLPDFGNFLVRSEPDEEWYDRYLGVQELMPYARAVSAKSYDFDESGEELRTDFARMLAIVLEAGYRGYVGIEYEGEGLSERAGIAATKELLQRVRDRLAPRFSTKP